MCLVPVLKSHMWFAENKKRRNDFSFTKGFAATIAAVVSCALLHLPGFRWLSGNMVLVIELTSKASD